MVGGAAHYICAMTARYALKAASQSQDRQELHLQQPATSQTQEINGKKS